MSNAWFQDVGVAEPTVNSYTYIPPIVTNVHMGVPLQYWPLAMCTLCGVCLSKTPLAMAVVVHIILWV